VKPAPMAIKRGNNEAPRPVSMPAGRDLPYTVGRKRA
jgi:hypothetical protein